MLKSLIAAGVAVVLLTGSSVMAGTGKPIPTKETDYDRAIVLKEEDVEDSVQAGDPQETDGRTRLTTSVSDYKKAE